MIIAALIVYLCLRNCHPLSGATSLKLCNFFIQECTIRFDAADVIVWKTPKHVLRVNLKLWLRSIRTKQNTKLMLTCTAPYCVLSLVGGGGSSQQILQQHKCILHIQIEIGQINANSTSGGGGGGGGH